MKSNSRKTLRQDGLLFTLCFTCSFALNAHAVQHSVRHIAHTLHRSASTITRELKRFACWHDRPAFVAAQGCAYDARAAGVWARHARLKPRRCSKLALDTVFFGEVQHFLSERWSPA